MIKKGSAVWKGSLKEGGGTISTETGVLRNAPYGFKARFVGSSEMAVGQEALGVDEQLAVAPGLGNCLNALGGLALESAARGDDGNPHWRCLRADGSSRQSPARRAAAGLPTHQPSTSPAN